MKSPTRFHTSSGNRIPRTFISPVTDTARTFRKPFGKISSLVERLESLETQQQADRKAISARSKLINDLQEALKAAEKAATEATLMVKSEVRAEMESVKKTLAANGKPRLTRGSFINWI